MAARTIAVFKFVGTISLGLATGVSFTLSTLSLPALLSLPTAPTAVTTYLYLSAKSTRLTTYLRHITTFSLFSAYLLSPRRHRHPYLLYTSIFAFAASPAVDALERWRSGKSEGQQGRELEEMGESVNGEMVRGVVERRQRGEWVKAGAAGVAFGMMVVGIWGDGA